MKTIVFGFVILIFAGIVITSPYWLFREIVRPKDEQLPDWMGDAQARKKRLIVIAGVLGLALGGCLIAVGLSGP